MARSVCALQANCRWAVTGTPIQNRLSDLAALLQFLRVDPYMNRKQFDSDISNIWKNGDTDEAIKRLKRLAGCLILRRKKTTISLPSRRDLQCPVEFTVAEREVYNEIRDQVISRIDYLIYENNGYDRPSGYVNVLQQIEAMRMVCNLGLYYCHRHKPTVIQDQATDWKAMAQPAFNFERETGAVECQYCPASVDVSDGVVDDLRNHKSPLFSQCLKFVCSDCVAMNLVINCGHNPTCAYFPVSLSLARLEETTPLDPPTGAQDMLGMGLPSKVAALVTQVTNLPLDVKRYDHFKEKSKWY